MKNLINKIFNLRNVSFVKHTAVMQVGAVFTNAVNIIASVIFARILLPDNYGVYTLVFTFAGLIFLFMNWGVDRATLVFFAEAYEKKNKEEIRNILIYFIKSTLLISIIIGGLGFLIAPILANYFYGDSYIGELARIIVLAQIFVVFFEITTISFQVLRKIKSFVILDNIKNLLRVILSVSLIFGFGVFGIMFGHLLAFFLALIIAILAYSHLSSQNELLPTLKDLFKGWRDIKISNYFKFGFSIAVNQNITRLYSILPILFLSMFFSNADVGYFNIALKYISLPLMLVAPVSQLLSVRLPQLKVSANPLFVWNFLKASIMSGFIVIILVFFAVLFAPLLVKITYGQEYMPAVKVIYYLAPFAVFSGFAVGMGPLFRTLNKMKEIIIINGAVVVAGVLPAFYLIKNYGLIGISIVTVVWFLSSDLISFLYIRKHLK